MKKKIIALSALILAAFLGGALFPSFVRIGTTTIHPFSFNFFRYIIATLVLLPVVFSLFKKSSPKKVFSVLPYFAFLGINTMLFSIGIQHTTIVASQLMYALTPAAVALLSYLLFRTKISKQKFLGIIMAISGVVILMFSSLSAENTQSMGTLLGNAIILVAMFSYAFYLIFSKRLSVSYTPLEITALTGISLSILFLPFATYDFMARNGLQNASKESLISLVSLALFTALFTFLIQYGVKNLSATTASMAVLLSPIFAFISGMFLFGESVSITLLISLSLVLGGMIVSIHTGTKKAS